MARTMIIFIVVLVPIIIFVIWQMTAYKVPEPPYTLLKKEGLIEIRLYSSFLMAEVEVKGNRQEAIQAGFRILADYIFGKNEGQQKIAMTAPVMQEVDKLSTITPGQKENGSAWHIRFVMPSSYSMDTLSKPINKAITIIRVPNKKYAVIKFKGSSSQANLDKHETLLRNYIAKHQLVVSGEAIYAFYNPPWILPIFRRNEIFLEINSL
jgi:effector-binding domain-containing protein